jgi:hypothetical protein
MANTALMTALGALGTGLSTYGRVKQEREALGRETEATRLERERLNRAETRAIESENANRQRQAARDILDAVLGGFRPAGMSSMTIGGQQFQLPEVVTSEEKIRQTAARFKLAYPQLNDAQAELLARREMTPGQMLVDPGTIYRGPRTTRTTTPPATSRPTQWSLNFGNNPLGLGR